jgi:hypothetical protein
VEKTPMNSKFKMIFVQCASCGGVIGVMDFYNIGQQTEQIKDGLKKVAAKAGVRLDF